MSYSYVKCCEGSVVWDVSKVPHEGIYTSESNIICVHSLLMERGACESFPSSLQGCVDPAGRRQEWWRTSMVQWGRTWDQHCSTDLYSCWKTKRNPLHLCALGLRGV